MEKDGEVPGPLEGAKKNYEGNNLNKAAKEAANGAVRMQAPSASVSGSTASDDEGGSPSSNDDDSESDKFQNDGIRAKKTGGGSSSSKKQDTVLAECTYKDYSQETPDEPGADKSVAGALESIKKSVPAKEVSVAKACRTHWRCDRIPVGSWPKQTFSLGALSSYPPFYCIPNSQPSPSR